MSTKLTWWSPGLAAEFLQHAAHNVTDMFYLNRYNELKEALTKMRMPAAFTLMPGASPEEIEVARLASLPEVRSRGGINPEEWEFKLDGFDFRGRFYACPSSMRLRFIRLLVEASPDPVRWETIATTSQRARQAACNLRKCLRENLGLPDDVDPVPCVSYGDGGAWTIYVPGVQP